MLYLSLNTQYNTFTLGLFKTKEEAQHAFLKFLTAHANFEKWFAKIKTYQSELDKELLLCNLEGSLFSTDPDDELFWDESGLLPTIIEIEPGELFDFRMWNGWVMEEWNRPLEHTHLYDLVKACLEGETYEIEYNLYAKHYPVLFPEEK